MKSRAFTLQMALSELQAKPVEQKFSDWRVSGYRPDIVYDMMRIAVAERRAAGASTARRYVIFDRMVQLLRNVCVFNSQQDLYEMGRVLYLLVTTRGEEEVTLVLHWLREEGRFDPCMATQVQGLLMVAYPQTVETMLSLWLRSTAHPKDVYKRLVEAATSRVRERVSPESEWKFLQWATHMHLYVADGRFEYGDDDMFLAFVRNGRWERDDGSIALLTMLRSVDGMEDRSS